MSAKGKAALGFIFVTLLIDITGIGILVPVMPDLLMELTGMPNSKAALYGGLLLTSYAVTQFLCAPIIGGLSDRFGRRPVLLASLFGFGVDYIFLALAPSVGWLFIGRIIAGILGASFTTGAAYIADISTPETRAQNFGLLGAAFGLGFILGPSMGAVLQTYGLRVPFYAAAMLSFMNWMYGFFILPESLSLENRRKFEWKRANPIGALKHLRKYPVISGLIVSLTLVYIAVHAVQSTWAFYTKEKFEWKNEIGYSLAFVGLLSLVIQGGLIRIIIPKLGQKRSLYFGLTLYALGFVFFGLATEGWMMYVFSIVYCLGGIAGPSLQGIISTQVPGNEQGELQGALASLMSLTSIFGPLLMPGLLTYFTSDNAPMYLPGAPMYMGAALTITSAILARNSLNKNMK